MAKLLKKVLYVFDVQRDIWFWYNPEQDLFYACDQMVDEQCALPTLVARTAIVGVRNVYDYPLAVLELQETFQGSLTLPKQECKEVKFNNHKLSLVWQQFFFYRLESFHQMIHYLLINLF